MGSLDRFFNNLQLAHFYWVSMILQSGIVVKAGVLEQTSMSVSFVSASLLLRIGARWREELCSPTAVTICLQFNGRGWGTLEGCQWMLSRAPLITSGSYSLCLCFKSWTKFRLWNRPICLDSNTKAEKQSLAWSIHKCSFWNLLSPRFQPHYVGVSFSDIK